MMPFDRHDETTSCPCLTPEVAHRAGVFPVPVYCRLADGRVRVPTRDQLVSLCTTGRYLDCPGYRRWAASRAWAGA